MLQLMQEGCLYTYPPLSIARYSFIQLSELEQCRVKKRAHGFNIALQDSNPGPPSQETNALVQLNKCNKGGVNFYSEVSVVVFLLLTVLQEFTFI